MNFDHLSKCFYEMRERQIKMHGRVVSNIDMRVSEVVLDAALAAMSGVQRKENDALIHAVPLGTGLGKSSSAYALIAAFALNSFEFSAAYVVPTIEMAIDAQEGIEALIGVGTTTLWTSLHKHQGVNRQRAIQELGAVPTRLVDKATLGAQRVIIVTHKLLEQELESGQDFGVQHFLGSRRSIVFIDEHPDFVHQEWATPQEVQALHDKLQNVNPEHPWLPIIAKSVFDMSQLTHGTGQRFVPAVFSVLDGAKVLEENDVPLWDLTNAEASNEVRCNELDRLQRVLSFLRAALQGRAFYCRKHCQFFSYSLSLATDYPGFVLLDATCELAGLVTQNSRVVSVLVPSINYERLGIYSIDMPKKFRHLNQTLKVAGTCREYGQFIKESVLANTKQGDDVLVVVHKDVLSMELLGASSDDPTQPLDWEGRRVNTQNWGCGARAGRPGVPLRHPDRAL